ncbi:MAG: S8 family serine peptidase, partial [Pseudomonadota bacterium]
MRGLLPAAALTLALTAGAASDRSPAEPGHEPKSSPTGRYFVVLESPPAAAFEGRRAKDGSWALEPTSPRTSGVRRLDVTSKAVQRYSAELAIEREAVQGALAARLGRQLTPVGKLALVANALILELTLTEADAIRDLPGIRAVVADQLDTIDTDAGPDWVGAPRVWEPTNGAPGNLGAGVVVGILDTGINWDHPAFADIGGDGHDHVNPLGRQVGECASATVQCNDKLIGVWDFTNEGTAGRDTNNHGSHVASTAAGNIRSDNELGVTVAGVAPHANIISYKVCVQGENDRGTCPRTNTLQALEQAVRDGVDVITFSIGSDPNQSQAPSPWSPANTTGEAFLNLREAGIF